jgi:membrane protease YdiL (CAAX protease family)
MLSGVFQRIYGTPGPGLKMGILGELMWTRLGVMGALSIGRMEVKGFGFVPTRKEWLDGLVNYLLFVPAGALLGWATGFAEFHIRPATWWQTTGLTLATFVGMLWVVALREEFFFRGLLQEWAEGWTKSAVGALVGVAVAFGLVHLGFRQFPNWRFALLATVAGLCYGRAYWKGQSVRAAMIAHALVNTTWRMFFS